MTTSPASRFSGTAACAIVESTAGSASANNTMPWSVVISMSTVGDRRSAADTLRDVRLAEARRVGDTGEVSRLPLALHASSTLVAIGSPGSGDTAVVVNDIESASSFERHSHESFPDDSWSWSCSAVASSFEGARDVLGLPTIEGRWLPLGVLLFGAVLAAFAEDCRRGEEGRMGVGEMSFPPAELVLDEALDSLGAEDDDDILRLVRGREGLPGSAAG
jgi:hypothetical protein